MNLYCTPEYKKIIKENNRFYNGRSYRLEAFSSRQLGLGLVIEFSNNDGGTF